MHVRITAARQTTRIAPAALLGHNLELFDRATKDLCTDRLENPTFAGPDNPATGIARAWASPTSNFMGIHYTLVEGEGILATNAQTLVSTSDRPRKGLVQPGRRVRAGETLAVTLWARAIHDPVTLRVALRPAAVWSDDYAGADIRLTSACWQEHTVTLDVPADDDHAVFCLWLEEPGMAAIDQVHLRPAGAGPIREDVLQALGAFQMPLVRFPGGCLTTAYHWQFGVGPQYLRPVLPDPVFKREMNYAFGTDEFLAFCLRYGITPVMTVNLGTNTPDEAVGWAAHCAAWYRDQGIEPPLMYWQMGNEQYGHWERAHMSGEMYAETVRAVAPGIRAAYPNSRIVALGMAHGETLMRGKRPWRAPLLDIAGDQVDVLAMQFYATLSLCDGPDDMLTRVLEAAEQYAHDLREAVDDCRARNLPTTVALSEWNLWLHASHFAPEGFVEPMDILHGLYAATMFHHFARLAPEMEFAAMYQIISCMCTFVVEPDGVRATHMADVFQLYRPALPGAVCDLTIDAPEIAPGLRAVEALALTNDAGQWLFLVNRSLDTPATVHLEGVAAHSGVTLAGDSLTALDSRRVAAALQDGIVSLPPLSITRLRG